MPEVRNFPYKQVNLEDFIPGSTYFRWREVLWLETWQVYVYPSESQYNNLVRLARKLDAIRGRLGKPMTVTSGLRPYLYNEWKEPYGIGGNEISAHCEGKACDFVVTAMPANLVRQSILPELDRLQIRMENLSDSAWVHVDIREPGPGGRYFKP